MDEAPTAETPQARGGAVLLAGVFGVGKTWVCAEMATGLEVAGRAYGAIDLDWLRCDAPGLDEDTARRIHLENVRELAGAYATAGVTRLAIAGLVRSNDGVDRLRAVLPFPLRAARLLAPLEVIEEQLATAPTEERRLRDARLRPTGSGTASALTSGRWPSTPTVPWRPWRTTSRNGSTGREAAHA